MRIHSIHSFGAIVLFLGHSILSGCSDNALDNVMEYDFSQLNAPNRETPQAIPELFIYANHINSSDYTDAYFYFFDASTHFSYFSPTEDFESSGHIKIRGNSTSQSPKKPYNIKFEKKTNLFGMGKAKKWALLSNPFDPTLIRNKLIYDLASNLSFIYSPKSYFIDVWVNDTFMGNYQIVEKIEFQKSRIPYDVDNGDYLFELVDSEKRNKADDVYFRTPVNHLRITMTEPEDPSSKQMYDFQEKMERIENAIATQDFSEYVKYVDLRSMIDYYWIEEFVNDPDLHTGSLFFTIHNGIMRGGPVWDFDLTLGNTKSESQFSTEGINAQKYWWRELIRDPSYQKIAYESYGGKKFSKIQSFKKLHMNDIFKSSLISTTLPTITSLVRTRLIPFLITSTSPSAETTPIPGGPIAARKKITKKGSSAALTIPFPSRHSMRTSRF